MASSTPTPPSSRPAVAPGPGLTPAQPPVGVSIGEDLLGSEGAGARPGGPSPGNPLPPSLPKAPAGPGSVRGQATAMDGTTGSSSDAGGRASGRELPPDEDSARADQARLDRWVGRLHGAIDSLAEAAGPRLLRLQGGIRSARGGMRRQAGLVRDDGEAWAESVRCTVREHPMKALAVAAVFGLLLARLSR